MSVVISRPNADRRYLVVFGVVVLVLLIFPLALAKTEFFRRHSSYFYNAVIYDKYSIKGNDADILLVGDSALVTGLIPAVIAKETGWTGYNLGVPFSSFVVHPDLIIDNYLAHNKRPKIIVLYLSFAAQVSNYDFDRGSIYEPAVTLLWHDSLRRNLEFYMSSPRRLIYVSATIVRSFLGGFDANSVTWTDIQRQLVHEQGFVPADAVSERRSLHAGDLTLVDVVPDRQYIEHFRSKYTEAGYQVVVALSPMADCDPSIANVALAYQGLLDMQPYVLPCDSFASDGGVHMFRRAAEENSLIFAKLLRAKI